MDEIMDSKLMGKYLIIIAVIITLISSSEANAIVSIIAPAKEKTYPAGLDSKKSSETEWYNDPEFLKSLDGPKTSELRDYMYRISGEITSMDVNQVKNIVQSKRARNKLYFQLNSSGGDIYAAMEIGKLIRKARATCVIPSGAKCYSACVFVLSGAVERFVNGKVGIHRPYSTYVGKRDYESTQNEYRRMETAVRAYLREMNLPEQLFEAMVRVPPEEIRILSDEEMEAFGLSGTDPVEQDTKDATDASYYGISKTEYIRRKASVDRVCPSPDFLPTTEDQWDQWDAHLDCTQAYMFGLDLPTYKARKARTKNICSGCKFGEECKNCYLGVLRGDR